MRLRLLLLGGALAAACGASQAQELGRLFFTPEQRDTLDARRKARVPDKPAAVVASPTIRLDGYVKRSRGPSTVWVNGETAEDSRIGADEVTIGVGEAGARVGLRPGETLDRGNGEVSDLIGGGEITVRRAPRR